MNRERNFEKSRSSAEPAEPAMNSAPVRSWKAASLAEMLVALGIAGSVIFTMLVIAARTSKQAVINQQRYAAAAAAAEGVELAIASQNYLEESVLAQICDVDPSEPVYIGILPGDDEDEPFEFYGANYLISPEDPEVSGYYLLPLKRSEDGAWEYCSECNDPGDAELLRGIELEESEGEEYWTARSIVWWQIFGENESMIINTRLEDVCTE